jgi:hypothetical protein
MYREEKRREERDRLVRSMAGKLATGNGIELIAAARRKKKLPTYLYITASIALFVITGLVLFFHAPEEIELKLNESTSEVKKVTMIQLMHKDLDERKITVNQYAFYLRDILVRYDSLPQNYRANICVEQTQDIYDSICATWSKISNNSKGQLLKELPKLESYLKEFQDKKSFNEK